MEIHTEPTSWEILELQCVATDQCSRLDLDYPLIDQRESVAYLAKKSRVILAQHMKEQLRLLAVLGEYALTQQGV